MSKPGGPEILEQESVEPQIPEATAISTVPFRMTQAEKDEYPALAKHMERYPPTEVSAMASLFTPREKPQDDFVQRVIERMNELRNERRTRS